MHFFNPLFFVISIALLIGASAWAILSRNEASAIRSPSRLASMGLGMVTFAPPQRQEFGFYFGNKNDAWRNRDPFVPLHGQTTVAKYEDDAAIVDRNSKSSLCTLPPPVPPDLRKNGPILPNRFPPPPDAKRFAIPQVIGMLKLGSERVGTIRLGTVTVQVREGESVNKSWKLVRLDSLRAILRSSLGYEIEVPVGLSAEKPTAVSRPPAA